MDASDSSPNGRQPRKRWLQFSLRLLLLAMTLLCFWLRVQANRARRQERAVAAVQALGGRLKYDYEYSLTGSSFGSWTSAVRRSARQPSPSCSRHCLYSSIRLFI